jgi:ketosteroid isomerase-like protein
VSSGVGSTEPPNSEGAGSAGAGANLVEVERDEQIAVVTMNRPERLNALTFDVYAELRDLFAALDAVDSGRLRTYLADDSQSVDELSGGWLRGREALETYFDRLTNAVSDIHSQLESVQTTEWGDTAIFTCELEQTYTLEGAEQRLRAPTSIVGRRENGEWKIVLVHSVPPAEQPGT